MARRSKVTKEPRVETRGRKALPNGNVHRVFSFAAGPELQKKILALAAFRQLSVSAMLREIAEKATR